MDDGGREGARQAVSIEYRSAVPADEKAVASLLERTGLSSEGIAPHLPHFVVAVAGGRLVGTAGCEVHGCAGLFRSFAVDPGHCGQGIGAQLYRLVVAHARSAGVREGYLLTDTAEGFFAKFGFQRVTRDAVPRAIRETEQFRIQCLPASVCMSRSFGNAESDMERQARA